MTDDSSTTPVPQEHPPLRLTRVLLITLLVVLAIFLLVPEAPQSSTENNAPSETNPLASADSADVH